jgi:uncharacterized caspase-like protein
MRRVSAVLALLLIGFAALAGATTAVQAQSAATGAHPEKRVALVIGNADYQFGKLANPVNDAENLRDALISVNFDVVFAENATLDVFAQKLIEFNSKAKTADVAVIYYAGHGVQHDGKNYLIPVNASTESLDDIDISSKPVDDLVDVLRKSKGVKILILDACRNNPAEGREIVFRSVSGDGRDVGLAAPTNLSTPDNSGMIVAYATLPDRVAEDGGGRNSPYNIALAKWITAPDLTLDTIFHRITKDVLDATKGRQHPNTFNTMVTDYVLNPSGSEWVDWDKAKNSQDIAEWRHFVDAHPDSAHAPDAKHRIELMQANLAQAAEAAWARIKDSSDPAELSKFKETFPDSPHAAEAGRAIAALEQKRSDQSIERDWDRLKDGSDLAGLQEFRRRYPNSSHGPEADRLIADLQRKSEEQTRKTAWDQIKTSSDRGKLQAFRDRYPDSLEAGEADKLIADLQRRSLAQTRETAWDQVKTLSDRGKLQAFRDRYPDSPEAAEADKLIADLQRRSDEQTRKTAWGQIKASSDRGKLQAFRDRYPDSPEAAEADKLIADLESKEFAQARKTAWGQIKDSSDLAKLEDFRDRYAGSPEAAEADKKIGALQLEAAWNRVKDADPGRLEDFRDLYPNSIHDAEAVQRIAKAERRIEDQRWEQVNNKSDIPGLQRFLDSYPSSPHAAEAGKQIASLQQEAAWKGVGNKADLDALTAFVTFYPNSPHAAEAEKLIAMLRQTIDQRQGAAGAAQQPADVAKQAEEACNRDSAEVAKIAKLGSANALKAMRQRSGMLCPTAIAAIDVALRDITCQDERDRVRARGDDLVALRGIVAALTCGDSLDDARDKIALLEQDHERAEKQRAEKACDDAKNEVDTRIDVADAGAREALAKFETRTDCPSVSEDAKGKTEEIDKRVSSAQILLAKFGCYKVEPPSGRFDPPTREAIGRFERGAHLTLDEAHLTADLLEKMQGNADAGVCQPTAPPPAPSPPPVAAIPREIPPAPATNPVRHEKAMPQSKPVAHPKALAETAAPRKPPPASAHSVASAPAPTSGAKPAAVFIPN